MKQLSVMMKKLVSRSLNGRRGVDFALPHPRTVASRRNAWRLCQIGHFPSQFLDFASNTQLTTTQEPPATVDNHLFGVGRGRPTAAAGTPALTTRHMGFEYPEASLSFMCVYATRSTQAGGRQ